MAGRRRVAGPAAVSSADGGGVYRGMNLAFCDELMARAIWRTASDIEAQIAHWLVQGQATSADLAEARRRVKAAHIAFQRARLVYRREALRVGRLV